MKRILYTVFVSTLIASQIDAATWQFVNNSGQAVDVQAYFGKEAPHVINKLQPGQAASVTVTGAGIEQAAGKGYDMFRIQIKPSSVGAWGNYGFKFDRNNPNYDRPTGGAGNLDATITILSLGAGKKTEKPSMFSLGYTQGVSQIASAGAAAAGDDGQ